MKRRSSSIGIIQHIMLSFLALLMIYPWLIAISTSLKAPGESMQNLGLIPRNIDLGKFVDVFIAVNVPRLAFNSLVVTGGTVILVLFLASLAAYAFARLDFIFKEVIFFGLLCGLMLQTAAIMVPLYQENVALHLLNNYFAMIGPYVALALPFAILILRGFFEGLPQELVDAAVVDGASEFVVYWRVLLPLTRPAMITVGIFVGLAAWNDFLLPMLFTTTTSMATLPLGLITFVQNDLTQQTESRFALIVMMMLPAVVLFIALQRQFIQGLAAGAVKE